jgi:glycosidase
MYLIIDLPIAITSREHAWFYHSARASIHADYADFYHWRRQSGNPKVLNFVRIAADSG